MPFLCCVDGVTCVANAKGAGGEALARGDLFEFCEVEGSWCGLKVEVYAEVGAVDLEAGPDTAEDVETESVGENFAGLMLAIISAGRALAGAVAGGMSSPSASGSGVYALT